MSGQVHVTSDLVMEGDLRQNRKVLFYPGIHERLLIKIYSEQGHLVGALCRLA